MPKKSKTVQAAPPVPNPDAAAPGTADQSPQRQIRFNVAKPSAETPADLVTQRAVIVEESVAGVLAKFIFKGTEAQGVALAQALGLQNLRIEVVGGWGF